MLFASLTEQLILILTDLLPDVVKLHTLLHRLCSNLPQCNSDNHTYNNNTVKYLMHGCILYKCKLNHVQMHNYLIINLQSTSMFYRKMSTGNSCLRNSTSHYMILIKQAI